MKRGRVKAESKSVMLINSAGIIVVDKDVLGEL